MKDEDAKHELRESESGQTRAKQKKDLQRSQPETPWKLIRREWYTTFSRAPARMEGLCRCTVREFSLQGCSFGPVDVLMQHRPIHMRRRDEDPSPSRCRLGRRGYPPASAAGWHGALDIQWRRGPRPGSRSGSFEPCRMSGSSRWRMKSATQAYQIIPDGIFMRGWRSDDGFAFPASGRSSMPDKSN